MTMQPETGAPISAQATTLREGAKALGIELDAQQEATLLGYVGMIGKWNRVYNLTAVRDEGEMMVLHLLDSLAVVPALRRHFGGRTASIMDVGSGAGLPGVVLAAVMPELTVTCVDTVGKKASFVRQVSAELKLKNLRSEHARVEQLVIPPVELITSRAFASLVDFTTLTRQHLAPEGVWMALKGKAPDDEIEALPKDLSVFHVEQLQVPGLDAERCLVWIRPEAHAA